MKMKTFVKYGLVALATGAFLEVGPPFKAGQPNWPRSHNGNQMPAAKVKHENAVQTSQLHKDDQRWLNIYKSLFFLGGA